MSTVSTTALTRTIRRGSISLIGSRPHSPIFSLPGELILEILELATAVDFQSSPFALARVCKAISYFIEHILYRTVVLHSSNTISLFFRTATAKPAHFLPSHVKRISVTATEHLHSQVKGQLVAIIEACTGVQTLALAHRSHANAIRLCSTCPSELILESYIDLSDDSTFVSSTDNQPDPLSSVARLRICEPGHVWDPLSSSLRLPMLNLTHLHLCRRAFANEENDAIFMEDVRSLLQSVIRLKMIVVSIFPPSYLTSDDAVGVENSDIWHALGELQLEDDRLFVVKGKYGSWISEWKDPGAAASPSGPPDFWDHVRQTVPVVKRDVPRGETAA